jgi:hypothetical protein
MLTGPYRIEDVDKYVIYTSPGVYILSRNGKSADYVGRSDNDLASRILRSASEGIGYTTFWFEYTSSPRDAYYKECEYYHSYNPPDNSVHPAVPQNCNWRCPNGDCKWG